MTVIRRSECPIHGADFGIAASVQDVVYCGRCRIPASKLVEVEYVPASQLQGAVKALEEIVPLLNEAIRRADNPGSKAAAVEARVIVHRAIGGQYASSGPGNNPVEPPGPTDNGEPRPTARRGS